jgi:hypothetical protein
MSLCAYRQWSSVQSARLLINLLYMSIDTTITTPTVSTIFHLIASDREFCDSERLKLQIHKRLDLI